jgi:hypothetical protein
MYPLAKDSHLKIGQDDDDPEEHVRGRRGITHLEEFECSLVDVIDQNERRIQRASLG